MRHSVVFTLASAFILSSCSAASDKQTPVDSSGATPDASSEATQSASQDMALASAAHSYNCESGESIVATYQPPDSAVVQYKGVTHNMAIAVSASGARYVGGELEWWTKGSGSGSEGTLFNHLPDGTSGERIESCREM